MRHVFLYWNGPVPNLIDLLRRIIYLHSKNENNYKVHLINPDNIDNYIDNTDIPDCFSELCYAHQADFVRVYVIEKYGGIWLDSDTLVMNDLSLLFDLLERKDGFLVYHDRKLINGIFGSKANTGFMKMWKELMIKTLDKKKDNISWFEIGATILHLIMHRNPNLLMNFEVLNGHQTIFPVKSHKIIYDEYVTKPYNDYKVLEKSFQPVHVLVADVYKKLSDFSLQELLSMNNPLQYFIKKSILESQKEFVPSESDTSLKLLECALNLPENKNLNEQQ